MTTTTRQELDRLAHEEAVATRLDTHYCKHGTYVGSWAGPDYMCGWCEDGTSDAEFAEWQARRAYRQRQAALDKIADYDRVAKVIAEASVPWSRAVQALEDFANCEWFADTRRELQTGRTTS